MSFVLVLAFLSKCGLNAHLHHFSSCCCCCCFWATISDLLPPWNCLAIISTELSLHLCGGFVCLTEQSCCSYELKRNHLTVRFFLPFICSTKGFYLSHSGGFAVELKVLRKRFSSTSLANKYWSVVAGARGINRASFLSLEKTGGPRWFVAVISGDTEIRRD